MIRANSFLGGKVYFRVVGELTQTGFKKPLENKEGLNENEKVLKTKEMENENSWDDLIFHRINARSEWLASLIWRNRQKFEADTSEDKDDDARVEEKINLDPSDKSMID